MPRKKGKNKTCFKIMMDIIKDQQMVFEMASLAIDSCRQLIKRVEKLESKTSGFPLAPEINGEVEESENP